jgi:hypothetical protein
MADRDIVTGIGLRHVRVAERDSDGTLKIPTGTATATPYAGLRISGANALTVTIPEPERVTAPGDDRIYKTFLLPPTEGVTGELRTSKTDFPVIQLLEGTTIYGSPPWRKAGRATDKQGEENDIVLWGSREGIDSDPDSANFGQTCWITYVLICAKASVLPPTMEKSTVGETRYMISANDATVDEVGAAFSEVINGFTRSPYIEIHTANHFWLEVWEGDGEATVFNMTNTPVSATTFVWVDGVPTAVTVDTSAKTITFAEAPADQAKVVAEYEYA